MLRSLIGAAIGSKIAPEAPKAAGAAGAAVATAIPFVLSRFSIPTMLMIGAGGYVLKRYLDKRSEDETPPEQKDALQTKPKSARSKTARKAVDAGVVNPPPGGATNGSGAASGAGASG